MKKYEFKNGNRIDTKTGVQVYTGAKSAVSPEEKTLMDIAGGKTPETDYERRLAKNIEKIKKLGGVVEIPAM